MRPHTEILDNSENFRKLLNKILMNRLTPYKQGILGYRILSLLHPAKSIAATKIAKTLMASTAHTSIEIRKLRKAGFIVDDADDDYRSNKYKLTAKGRSFIATVSGRVESDFAKKVRSLSTSDKEGLVNSLRKFVEVL